MERSSLRTPTFVLTVWTLASTASAQIRAVHKIDSLQLAPLGCTAPVDSERFGTAMANLGDLGGLLGPALAVSSPFTGSGLVRILFLQADGTVATCSAISSGVGGFGDLSLQAGDRFGVALAALPDIDMNGTPDLVVTAENYGSGAAWVLLLDASGAVIGWNRIDSSQVPIMGADFGSGVASLGDIDGDGTFEIAIGNEEHPGGGPHRGGVWIVSVSPSGAFSAVLALVEHGVHPMLNLNDGDSFGNSVAWLGDIDNDASTVGILAVNANNDDDGGPDRGAVWLLGIDSAAVVQTVAKVSSTSGGFGGPLHDADSFGVASPAFDWGVANTVAMLAGASGDDDGGPDRGAVWALFLNGAGPLNVDKEIKFSSTHGCFPGPLADFDGLSSSTPVGDLDGDGRTDIVLGASNDDGGGPDRGAVYVVLLDDLGAASASTRNGAGTNPASFSFQGLPLLGSTWGLDVVHPIGTAASLVAISRSPLPGFPTPYGQLLCLPPFFRPFSVSGTGNHGIAIPCDNSLVGLALCAQAATLRLVPLTLQLTNAIDFTIGNCP